MPERKREEEVMADEKLEAAIDEAGRDEVFAEAHTLGWGLHNPPPKWVWWEIVYGMRKAEQNKNGTKQEGGSGPWE